MYVLWRRYGSNDTNLESNVDLTEAQVERDAQQNTLFGIQLTAPFGLWPGALPPATDPVPACRREASPAPPPYPRPLASGSKSGSSMFGPALPPFAPLKHARYGVPFGICAARDVVRRSQLNKHRMLFLSMTYLACTYRSDHSAVHAAATCIAWANCMRPRNVALKASSHIETFQAYIRRSA